MNKLLRFSVTVICVCSVFAGCEKGKSESDSVIGLWAVTASYDRNNDGGYVWEDTSDRVWDLYEFRTDGTMTLYETYRLEYANGTLIGASSLRDCIVSTIMTTDYEFRGKELWVYGGFKYGTLEFKSDDVIIVHDDDPADDFEIRRVSGFREE